MVPGPGGDRPWAWAPVAALPPAGQSPVVTARWNTAQAAETTNVCQGLEAAVTPATSLPAAQPQARHAGYLPRPGALAGGTTTTPGTITPANSLGGTQ